MFSLRCTYSCLVRLSTCTHSIVHREAHRLHERSAWNEVPSGEQRIELAREATREFIGDRFAYTMAVHTPLAQDNIEQPHAPDVLQAGRRRAYQRAAGRAVL